jgi:hypothetical protein
MFQREESHVPKITVTCPGENKPVSSGTAICVEEKSYILERTVTCSSENRHMPWRKETTTCPGITVTCPGGTSHM